MTEPYVEIETEWDQLRASFLRNTLEAEGIPVIVQGASLQGYYVGSPGFPVQILVPRERAEEARRILADVRARTKTEPR